MKVSAAFLCLFSAIYPPFAWTKINKNYGGNHYDYQTTIALKGFRKKTKYFCGKRSNNGAKLPPLYKRAASGVSLLRRNGEVRKWQATCRAKRASLRKQCFPKPLPFERQKTKILEVKPIEKKVKRTRPYAYSFRVSEEEKQLLDEKVSASGLNKTDYLIRVLSDKPIVSIKNGNEILAELKRQGNNLNQAVKNIYFGDITEQELLSVVDDCKAVYRKLSAVIGGS